MATYTPTRPVDQLGHDRQPPAPPLGGGGDEGRGDGSPNYGARLRRARLGMICAIATVCMVFVSLTSALIVRRGLPTFDDSSRTYFRDWGGVQLPWLLLAINTAILLISSLTMEGARRGIARRAALAPVGSIPGVSLGRERNFPWLGVTVILGLAFLVGQGVAWADLRSRGFFVSTNPDSSFVYLFTAAHAVHLLGGIIALSWASITSLLHRPIEDRRIVVDVAAWYWHFMAVLWIYVFALLAFAR
ncbi:MAG TPA: cytochrome c oxidase subunit 3 [Verrucomicrobiae bacterium]|jgi:cytochrome c oxidase subunit 3|nr:cytochrome c oxidase subunit 3 [Verrucomicrobiae bacterium]